MWRVDPLIVVVKKVSLMIDMIGKDYYVHWPHGHMAANWSVDASMREPLRGQRSKHCCENRKYDLEDQKGSKHEQRNGRARMRQSWTNCSSGWQLVRAICKVEIMAIRCRGWLSPQVETGPELGGVGSSVVSKRGAIRGTFDVVQSEWHLRWRWKLARPSRKGLHKLRRCFSRPLSRGTALCSLLFALYESEGRQAATRARAHSNRTDFEFELRKNLPCSRRVTGCSECRDVDMSEA